MAGNLTNMIASIFSGSAVTADPYYEYTTLLLPGSGTNGAQNNTFLDGSTNNFTITRNGNTTQGTFSPFSQTGWGNYFDGTGDSLNTTSSSAFNFSTGSFTLECWFNKQGAGGSADAVGNVLIYTGSGANNATWLGVTDSGTLIAKIGYSGSWATEISGGSVSNGVWNHVALVRNGTAVNLYLNGTSIASASNSTDLSTFGTNSSIAVNYTSTRTFNGYISNARIVNGVAVYTGNFTPPTSPLAATQSAGTNISAITGTQTSLLTCQSNRFIDNSTNNFTITRNGDTRVVAFSPFNPSASWSAATYGGSGYFDGTGDYLNFTDSANILDMGGIAASVEAWVYPLGNSGNHHIISKSGGDPSWSTTNGIYWIMRIVTGQFGCEYRNGTVVNVITGGTATLNTWHHVAIATDTSNNIALFVNGVRVGTATNAITKPTNRTLIQIADFAGASVAVNAYISGICFKTSTSAYAPTSSTIIIPTAPVTAITNTSLLLNFTNAGIYDATSKNVLETVGDAKISTAQSKWGSGSLSFNGTTDYLQGPRNTIIDLGSGDFTIELWAYITSTTAKAIINLTNKTAYPGLILKGNDTNLQLLAASGDASWAVNLNVTGLSSVLNTWVHIAGVRSGNVFTLYRNGTSVGTTTVSMTVESNLQPVIGVAIDSVGISDYFSGYMQDVRITRAARYTGNFTPPTAQFAYNQSDIGYKQWVPANFSTTAGAGNDSLLDVPTNWGVDTGLGGEVRGNYCTLNPLANSGTLSNGNLDYAGSSSGQRSRSTFVVSSGKWYWEVTNLNVAGVYVGVVDPAEPLSNQVGAASTGYGIYGDGSKYNNSVSAPYASSWLGVGSVIGIALDLDAGTFACYINGAYQGIAYSGLTGPKMPALSQGTNNASVAVSCNFGQRAFAYAAPAGFKSLNTHNLPALAVVKSNTAFDTVLYTGNGSTQTVSGLNFSPDLVWIKRRDSNWSNAVYDSIRGAGSLKALSTNATDAEGVFNADTTYGYLSAFNSNGFAVVNGTTGGYTNLNGATYAAWAWDAGTTTVTSTAGTISAQVRANPTTGFSIVTYTGTGANATVGHGLSTAPSMIIVKIRSSSAENWLVYHASLSTPSTAFLYLNSTTAASTLTTYWNGGPTSSVFGLGAYSGINNSTSTYVAYCWATVPGYSAFGSYVGNGSADGPFIYTGFRPRWLLIRRSDTIENWNITDTARDPYNIASLELYPNLTNVEAGSAASYRDFLSNGFKIRSTGGGFNTSGGTYIYAAFAEQPFKYSRAR